MGQWLALVAAVRAVAWVLRWFCGGTLMAPATYAQLQAMRSQAMSKRYTPPPASPPALPPGGTGTLNTRAM